MTFDVTSLHKVLLDYIPQIKMACRDGSFLANSCAKVIEYGYADWYALML